MARINVEDSLYKDIRFITLIGKLGSLEMALGAMVRAWSIAQDFILSEETDRLIPKTEWKRQQIRNEILEVGLAEERAGGIYVSGAEEQFAWLLQRREAGKKGGRPPKNKEHLEVSPENRPVSPQTGSNPLPLTLSLSLTHNNNSTTVVDAVELEPAFSENPLVAQVVSKISAATRKSWLSRYEPSWLVKTLLAAIEYHIAKENALDPAEINDWGVRLVKWLRREKKPSILDPRENNGDFIAEFESELQKNEVKP